MALHPFPQRTVAIIGAGIAGIACGRALQSQGLEPVLFDKGYRVGGRLSTRTRNSRQFDHGAQYFTAKGQEFGDLLTTLKAQGVVQPWASANRFHDGHPRWVGVGGNRCFAEHLAQKLDVRTGTKVAPLVGTGELFSDEDHSLGGFGVVVVTAPLAQAAVLLATYPSLCESLAGAAHAPCWALLLEVDHRLALKDVLRSDGAIAWAARDSSKPGRDRGRELWVVHASAAWSKENLELSNEQATARLLRLAERELGFPATPAFADAHRWRYAKVEKPVGEPCLVDRENRIVVAGDGLLGPRIECAWQSGRAAAQAVARLLL